MITEIKGPCTFGVFFSLLRDTHCTNAQFHKIFDEIVARTNFETNFTALIPCEIPELVIDLFRLHQLNFINKPDQLNAIDPVDNIISFGFLFWRGNDAEENQHATRYVGKLHNGIELMDPQKGKCIKHYYPYKELFHDSTKGFDSLILLRS